MRSRRRRDQPAKPAAVFHEALELGILTDLNIAATTVSTERGTSRRERADRVKNEVFGMTYDDFEVRIYPSTGDRLQISAVCQAGERTVEVAPAIGPAESRRLFDDFQAAWAQAGAVEVDAAPSRSLAALEVTRGRRDLAGLGRLLFAFLFPPDLLSLWDTCRDRSKRSNKGLRLRIHLDLTRRELCWLGAIPWELLFDPRSDDFLAIDGQTPVVRYLDVRQDRRPFPRTRPWRVLVVMPEPHGAPPLNLEMERHQLLKTWGDIEKVQLVFPKRPTFDDIRHALGQAPIHGIHFMGHGVFDERTGWGGLLLESTSGGGAPLQGPNMKKLVMGIEPPALVVLNGCETGRIGDGPEPFGGAAAALMDAGVPAVVAMQLPVGDEVAAHFSRILYRALQDGHPVDWAVSEARLSLSEVFRDQAAWAIPSLFMRVPDGRLFVEEDSIPHLPQVANEEVVVKEIYEQAVDDSTIDSVAIHDSGSSAADTGCSRAEYEKIFQGPVRSSHVSTVGIRRGN